MASMRGFGLGGAIAAVAGVGLVGLLGYRAMSGKCMLTGACLNSGDSTTTVVSDAPGTSHCSGGTCDTEPVELVSTDAQACPAGVCPMSGGLAANAEGAENLSIVNTSHAASADGCDEACDGSCGHACGEPCDGAKACDKATAEDAPTDPIG